MQPECQPSLKRTAVEIRGCLIHLQVFSLLQHRLQQSFSSKNLPAHIEPSSTRETHGRGTAILTSPNENKLNCPCLQEQHFITYFRKSTMLLARCITFATFLFILFLSETRISRKPNPRFQLIFNQYGEVINHCKLIITQFRDRFFCFTFQRSLQKLHFFFRAPLPYIISKSQH
jgi:hypothetical protein